MTGTGKRVVTIIYVMSSFAFGRRILSNGIGRAAFVSHRPHANLGRVAECNNYLSNLPLCISGGTHLFSSSVSAKGGSATTNEEEQFDFDTILPFEKNTHNSVKIVVPEQDEKTEIDAYDMTDFYTKLEATTATVKELGKSALWLDIPISRARLMEEASKSGFELHHAEGNVATLSKWLIHDQESRIPAFATHQVGVGAIVINPATEEILCVREKRNNYRPWKVPGGLAELGEHLDEAVIREVYEETGIKCQFENVLAVRHVHAAQFGRSDLYFVCRLQPIPDEDGKVAQPIPQEGEIAAASWLPLAEYRDMVQSKEEKVGHPMMSRIMEVVDQSSNIQRLIIPSVVPGRELSPLYHAPIASDKKQS